MNSRISQNPALASAAMRTIEHDIACAIRFDASVMISGERGAGKKFVAHLIHQRSPRGRAPFVVANCQDMMQSVLHDGTVLVEDIERIPVPVQSQLLQFLEREMNDSRHLRLMTATRTDLFARVRSHEFSDDLFYHLNRIHLVIPALRDRPEDIPILFQHYLSFYARTDVPRLSTAAWDRLAAYAWPGNVQELKAAAEAVAGQDLPRPVEPDDLPSPIGRSRVDRLGG